MHCRGIRLRMRGWQPVILSVAFALLSVPPSFAGAAVEELLLSPQSLCANSGNDGHDELQSMLERVHRLKGYSYDSVLTTYVGDKKVTEIGKLYFKNPNLVRFEVIKSGSRSGAVVVKQADGKIRGRMGGMFKGIKVTLSPDSKILKTANGFSIMQSDLDSLISGVAKIAKGDLRCLALGPGSGRPAIVEILESDGDVEHRIAVDSRSKLPSEWNIFNSSKLFSTLQFNNIEERNDLSDSMFTFGSDGESKSLNNVSLSPDSGLGALQASPNRPIDAATCKDIERVITQISIICDQVPTQVAQGDGWIAGTRETLLSTCTDLEVLQYALGPINGAIENAKSKSGGAGGAGAVAAASSSDAESIGKQWNDATASFRGALDQLLEQLSNDQPDNAAVKKSAVSLKSSVKTLRAASDRVQYLIPGN